MISIGGMTNPNLTHVQFQYWLCCSFPSSNSGILGNVANRLIDFLMQRLFKLNRYECGQRWNWFSDAESEWYEYHPYYSLYPLICGSHLRLRPLAHSPTASQPQPLSQTVNWIHNFRYPFITITLARHAASQPIQPQSIEGKKWMIFKHHRVQNRNQFPTCQTFSLGGR